MQLAALSLSIWLHAGLALDVLRRPSSSQLDTEELTNSSFIAASLQHESSWHPPFQSTDCQCKHEIPTSHVPPGAVAASSVPCLEASTTPKFGTPAPDGQCFKNSFDANCLPAVIGPALYVIGDSHALHLLPGIKTATSMHVASMSWQAAKLSAADVSALITHLGSVMKSGDMVLVGIRFGLRNEVFFNNLLQGVSQIAAIQTAQQNLVVVDDVPQLPQSPQTCAISGNVARCTSTGSNAGYAATRASILNGCTTRGNTVWDLHSLFCLNGQCGPQIPGTSIYSFSDDNHLTVPGSLYLAPWICDHLHH